MKEYLTESKEGVASQLKDLRDEKKELFKAGEL